MQTASEVRFVWDEPPGCTTPRGWVRFRKSDHPCREVVSEHAYDYHCDTGALCCGNYLSYEGCHATGPEGEKIHATAYVFTFSPLCSGNGILELGFSWHHTIETAREWIEERVRQFCERP